MVTGTQIRLNRILRKGKMLCIPMDHGISNGPIEGLQDPHSIIYKCESHGFVYDDKVTDAFDFYCANQKELERRYLMEV